MTDLVHAPGGERLPFDPALMHRAAADDTPTLTVASRLMQNYQAAAPVDHARQIRASSDAAGRPMLFAIGGDGRLRLFQARDGDRTGWATVDLSTGLPGGTEVRRFAVARDPRGNPMLAAVCAPEGRPSETVLYYTADFSADPSGSRWIGKGRKAIGEILDVAAGSNAAGEVLLVITAKEGDRITSYRVLPDSTEKDWKAQVLPFPENGKGVLGIAVGHLASLEHIAGRDIQGVLYTLYRDNAGTPNLVLTSFPDTLYNHEVPVEADTAALAVAPDGKGSTVLYTGGNGVWFYSVAAEMERDRRKALRMREGVEAAAEGATPVHALVADSDTGGAPEVWILREGGRLAFSRRGAAAWSLPLPLAREAGEIASWRAAPEEPVELYYVSAADELHHLTQDPVTTNWLDTQVVLESTSRMVPFASYVTKATLTGAEGGPAAGRKVRITASETTLVTVNGRAFFVGPAQAVEAETDGRGSVTVTNRVSRLSTPLLRLEADFLGHAVEIDPTAEVHAKLTELAKGDPRKLVDAKVTNARGERVPLLTGKYADVQNVKVAYDVLNELLPLARPAGTDPGLRLAFRVGHDDPRAAGVYLRARETGIAHRIDLSGVPAGWSWGVDFRGERPRFIPGAELAARFAGARERVAEVGGLDDVWEFFGNLFRAVKEGLIAVGEFVLRTVEGVVELWIDGFRVVLEYVEQVWTAIDWFFTEVLGTAIDKLLEWLGFIFDWDDILATHRALVAAFDTTIDTVIARIGGVEPSVAAFFQKLEAELVGGDLAGRLGTAAGRMLERTGTTVSRSTPANRPDPASDWIFDQLSGGAIFGGSPASPFGAPLEERIVSLLGLVTGAAWDTLREGFEAIQKTLTEDFDRLSAGELVKEVAAIVAATALAEVENAVLGFLEVVKLVLDGVRDLLEETWDVPLLSALYRWATDGSELSALDLACLILAIPTTVVYKIATGEAPFSGADAARLRAAPDHPALVRELRAVAAGRAARAGREVSQTKVDLSLAFGGVGVGVGRMAAGIVSGVGVGGQEISKTTAFRATKLVVDLATYACAFTNLMLAVVPEDESAPASATAEGVLWYERAILLSQIAFPITDAIGWAAAKSEAARKAIPWVKTVMGGVNAVAMTVLFILEAVEAEKEKGEVVLDDVLKFVENLILATSQILAGPASLAKDPRPRAVFAASYVLLGVVGGGLNIGRAVPVWEDKQLFRPI
ncbi:MAG TPA: hypothetical protein VHG91_06705 [Longimicrobium sp.]|nr:hypothetical protein [Longimicrobium sp.]